MVWILERNRFGHRSRHVRRRACIETGQGPGDLALRKNSLNSSIFVICTKGSLIICYFTTCVVSCTMLKKANGDKLEYILTSTNVFDSLLFPNLTPGVYVDIRLLIIIYLCTCVKDRTSSLTISASASGTLFVALCTRIQGQFNY